MHFQQKEIAYAANTNRQIKQNNTSENRVISQSKYSSIYNNSYQNCYLHKKASSLNKQAKHSSTNSVKEKNPNNTYINSHFSPYKSRIPKSTNTSIIEINSNLPSSTRIKKVIPKTYSIPFFPQQLVLIKQKITRNNNTFFNIEGGKANPIMSQDKKLRSLDSHDEDLSDNSLCFPKELSNSMNLNKYKITSLTNVATNNSTIGMNINGELNNSQRNGISQVENKDVMQCNKEGFPEFSIITNNIISDLSDNNQSSLLAKNFLNQYQIKAKDTKMNQYNSNIESYYQLNKNNASIKMTNQITKSQTNNSIDEINTIMDNLSPIIKPINYQLHSSKENTKPLSRNNQLKLDNYINDDSNDNDNCSHNYQLHQNQKKQNRMIIEYLKLLKSNNNSIEEIANEMNININKLSLRNIPSFQLNNSVNQNRNQLLAIQTPQKIIKSFDSPNTCINNKKKTHCSIPASVRNIDLSSFNNNNYNDKITLLNFLSVPKIINLVVDIDKGLLVPCVFAISPDHLSYTHGIETYVIHIKSIGNINELNAIDYYINVSDVLSCNENHFSRLRFTLQVIHDISANSNKNKITEYIIEASSYKLKMNYVKGINNLQFQLKKKLNKRKLSVI